MVQGVSSGKSALRMLLCKNMHEWSNELYHNMLGAGACYPTTWSDSFSTEPIVKGDGHQKTTARRMRATLTVWLRREHPNLKNYELLRLG